jgi:5-methylcytosine-specific restriction protein A
MHEHDIIMLACMPSRAPHPCNSPRCPALTTKRFCAVHTQESKRAWRVSVESTRPNARERGYDSRWQKARRGYLAKHTLCAECERRQRVTLATVVDHIVPHRGDMELFWTRSNWQGLCEPHHRIKTAREVGERRRNHANE